MKKMFSSQSAFLNAPVLTGLFLAGISLAMVGFGMFSTVSAQSKQSRPVPAALSAVAPQVVPPSTGAASAARGVQRQPLTKQLLPAHDVRPNPLASQFPKDVFTDPATIGRGAHQPAGAGCPYTITPGTNPIVPGTTDTGNHTDDGTTFISLPFSYQLYGQSFTGANISSNGNLQFVSNSTLLTNACPLPTATFNYPVMPSWDDLRTDQLGTGCAAYGGVGCGVFTSISGTAPNRIFNIEWRTVYFGANTTRANFEVRFYESQNRFDLVYGEVAQGGSSATVGVQQDTGSEFTQFECNTAGTLTSGLQLAFTEPPCGTPTPTPTATPGGCQFHVLIVYADTSLPTQLQSEILAEPGVIAVDLFDGMAGTPTLAQLQQYDIVVPYSNFPFTDADTLGNNLADYVDAGGIVVQYGFSHFGPGQPYGVNGRWVTDNYKAYDYSTNMETNAFSLGTFNAGHPLMAGVTTLNSNFANLVTPAAGATEVAQNNLGESLVAYRPVSGGHTTVGVTGYVGSDATQSGDWGRVIVNAGNWLRNCQGGTPTPTPACTPGWPAGADLPSAGVRLVGVHFPANGRFYAMGGRSSDAAGSDFTHPFEYDPSSNSWTTKSATYPDNQVNNMACGVLTDAGTPYIYCVGGSAAGAVMATDRVFRYDPVTDTISAVAASWPGAGGNAVLPGGFTIFQNKLYILGGFDLIAGNATNQIWEFTPGTISWLQKAAVLPVPRGYIPTTTIGTLIFTGGGTDITGGVLTDTTDSFVYNPVGDTISTIASIPRATGETRALNVGNQMWVLGGGRTAPNPSNEVDIYDPVAGTWTTGLPFTTARRNFPADTDGSTRIWLAGGYDSTGVAVSSMEIFCGGGGAATPTPTPSATASPTGTPAASPTPTTPPSPAQALNISTRLRVQTGNNVLIGGFIITGTAPKTVAVRGIGPSLSAFGIPDPLADPTLELHASSGTLIMQNDNWQDDPTQAALLTALGLGLQDTHESGLVTTLPANASYTAILAGKDGGIGVGLVEIYDTNQAASSQLANISTRGFVLTDNNVMIGGFILGGGSNNAGIAVRGIGPTLAQFGLSPVLADPTLELHDSNGMLLVANDNWQDDPVSAAQLTAHGLAPQDPLESGIFTSLPPGAFTAILAGKDGGTGIGLVEIYNVQ